MQTPIGNQADYGSESSGVVVKLKVGDLIGLKTVYRSFIWLTKHHTSSALIASISDILDKMPKVRL